jgi:DNA-binding CsgD family transcriptional regulator
MQDLSKIVDDLYAGTLDDAAWDRALVSIADVVRGSAAYLFAFNPITGEVLRDENHRGDQTALAEYRNYWTYEDIRRPAFAKSPVGCLVTESMLDANTWRRSPILNEFLAPLDSSHILAAWLHKKENKSVALSIQGTRKRGAFGPRDVEIYRWLAPHITRALAIRDRLECLRVRANTLTGILGTVCFGVVVLDALGCILDTNTRAQELFRNGSGIRRRADGTLSLRGVAGVELRRWILTGQPPEGSDGLLRVRRPSGGAISVLVTPLPAATVAWISRDPRWMVLLFDPERAMHVSAALIEGDLGISTREAQLSALRASGCSLRDISARLSISPHTARNHLKAILRKTGLRSQSDLILRISMGPAVLAVPPVIGSAVDA